MVLFSIKKLIDQIEKKSITKKQFVIYAFFAFVPLFSVVNSSRFPASIEAHNIAYALSFVIILINVIKYVYCYKIIKNSEVDLFLYTIIPLNFVLSLRYTTIVMLPLVFINLGLINFLSLDFNFWNVINSQIISIIMNIIIAVHFISIFRNLYNSSIYGNSVAI